MGRGLFLAGVGLAASEPKGHGAVFPHWAQGLARANGGFVVRPGGLKKGNRVVDRWGQATSRPVRREGRASPRMVRIVCRGRSHAAPFS